MSRNAQLCACRNAGTHHTGPFRTGANMGKSFGVEVVPTCATRLVFGGGAVNGREVLACPKLQHSIETVYRMLSAPPKGVRGPSTTGAAHRYRGHPDPVICRRPAPAFRKSVPTQRSVSYTASYRRALGESSCYLQPFLVPQSELEFAAREANSALEAVGIKAVSCSL